MNIIKQGADGFYHLGVVINSENLCNISLEDTENTVGQE